MKCRFFLSLVIVSSMVVIGAVSWHSVQEIHYLKSFYPRQFTVQDVFYASAVELIKVLIITLPVSIIAAISLYTLRWFENGP